MMTVVAAHRRRLQLKQLRRPTLRLNVRTLDHLARRLAVPLSVLEETATYVDLHYGPSRYLTKKDKASFRTIEAPRAHLKEIQRCIYRNLLAGIWLPDSLHAYRKDHSVISAMAPHRGRLFWWCADIAQFYPSISFKNVYDIFVDLGCSPDVARILTRLTTHNYHLPQGAPTSPALANLYLRCFGVARRLEGLAQKQGLRVTFYGDDIIVSGNRPFKHLQDHMEQIIRSSGLRLNREKTSAVLGPDARHEALGVVANAGSHGLDAARAYRRRVRSLLRLCRRFGLGVLAARGVTTAPGAFLRGKISFAIQINPRNRELLRDLEDLLSSETRFSSLVK
jgi:RNA-directed DNA polymerase